MHSVYEMCPEKYSFNLGVAMTPGQLKSTVNRPNTHVVAISSLKYVNERTWKYICTFKFLSFHSQGNRSNESVL